MDLQLNTMEVEFRITFQKSGMLPVYPGSLLRSVIGRHLFEQSCIVDDKNCELCRYQTECPYGFLYEPNSKWQHKHASQQMHFLPPHYVLATPELAHPVAKGQLYVFSVKFFQADSFMISSFIKAVHATGKSGIGADRITFTVDEVHQKLENGIDIENPRSIQTEERKWANSYSGKSLLHIRALSPVRLQQKGKMIRKVSFDDFLQAVKRRVMQTQFIWREHDIGASHSLQSDMIYQESYKELSWESKYIRQKRFSRSQEKEIPLDGVIFQGQVQTDNNDLIELLRYGSYVQIGKQTAFGLGNYQMWLKID